MAKQNLSRTDSRPAAGCSLKPAVPTKPVKVSVNGVDIPRDLIARETQNHPAGKPIEAWIAAARALVVRELLLQEARRLSIAAEPLDDGDGRRETEEEAVIRQLVEREVVTPEPDEAACRRYYDKNRQRFKTPTLYEVRHILVAARGGARKEAEATARSLIEQLQVNPAAFAEFAESYSACPSAKTGGSLGQISRGQTVAEFEAALGELAVGEISPKPIETRYGFHVIIVDRRIEGRELPFEMVSERIAQWLGDTVRHTAIRQYISILAGSAEITGITLDENRSPLVQ